MTVLTPKEAARMTGYTPQHIRELCRAGALDCYRIPAHFRYEEWLIMADSLARYQAGGKGPSGRAARGPRRAQETPKRRPG